MVVVPDAVSLTSEDCTGVAEAILKHCNKTGARFGILDVYDGDKPRTNDATDDVIDKFRKVSGALKYGAAYYPWLKTTVFSARDIDYRVLDEALRKRILWEAYLDGEGFDATKGGTKRPIEPTALIDIADTIRDGGKDNFKFELGTIEGLGVTQLTKWYDVEGVVGKITSHVTPTLPSGDAISNQQAADAREVFSALLLSEFARNTDLPLPQLTLLEFATTLKTKAREIVDSGATVEGTAITFEVGTNPTGIAAITDLSSLKGGAQKWSEAVTPSGVSGELQEPLKSKAKDEFKRLLVGKALRTIQEGPADASVKLSTDIEGNPDYGGLDDEIRRQAHSELLNRNKRYAEAMSDALAALNCLPPSGAMAGIYARVDKAEGVHRAPANVGIALAVEPAVKINDDEQMELNAPTQGGKAVNALRTFQGTGLTVWGARTLDGNSQDWRYINVRRTMIMIRQSVKNAVKDFVFAPNTPLTWSRIESMISGFLYTQWRAEALVGDAPEEAYYVLVGEDAGTTADDIRNGLLLIKVGLNFSRPAEFIEVEFTQMQEIA